MRDGTSLVQEQSCVCSGCSPAASLTPVVAGLHQIQERSCEGKGYGEDLCPDQFAVQVFHSEGKDHTPSNQPMPRSLPLSMPGLLVAPRDGAMEPCKAQIHQESNPGHTLGYRFSTNTLLLALLLMPPSSSPLSTLEETVLDLFALKTSQSQPREGWWDVSLFSAIPRNKQDIQLSRLSLPSLNSSVSKRARAAVAFIPLHTDLS